MTESFQFSPIEDIVGDIRAGKIVIIADDECRENEGDLIFAASAVNPEKVNFLMKHGRGLICVSLTEERCEHLGLKPMIRPAQDPMRTAFTVSVDAKLGTSTGISAFDRSRTIELLADPDAGTSDFISPGHIFPLIAKKGGVLARAGHTEAAADLARLAGLEPSGVLCEIVNDDGTMARLPDIMRFAEKHQLKVATVRDLIEYRRRFDKMVALISESWIPTVFGKWHLKLFRSLTDASEHIALIQGDVSKGPVLIRVHSECFTGDVLGSLRCDCQDQLIASMERIQKEGNGVILYMRQEGRGIGLANKLKAYALQDKGFDTVEANQELGFKPDLRDYGIGAEILRELGLTELRLMTNNPRKIVGLEGYGLKIVERVPLEIPKHQYNARYLKAKKEKLGHLLDL